MWCWGSCRAGPCPAAPGASDRCRCCWRCCASSWTHRTSAGGPLVRSNARPCHQQSPARPGTEVPSMSKQTLELRGRRARTERRRVEKALKRRLETEESLLDGATDGADFGDGPNDPSTHDQPVVSGMAGGGANDQPDVSGVAGVSADNQPVNSGVDGVSADDPLVGSGADHATNGSRPNAPPTQVVWSGLVAGVQRGGALTVLAEGRTCGASLA